ncbi:hypothetical protein TNCV_271771 [Trichonephila clavipes]|nr:hypothetical protein TNCV_271771 [Trichonephila clavipes]
MLVEIALTILCDYSLQGFKGAMDQVQINRKIFSNRLNRVENCKRGFVVIGDEKESVRITMEFTNGKYPIGEHRSVSKSGDVLFYVQTCKRSQVRTVRMINELKEFCMKWMSDLNE